MFTFTLPYTPTRQLRSSNMRLLQQPHSSTDIARRAFSRAAPTVYNNLHTDSRFADSFMNLSSLLHTHCYRLAFKINLSDASPGPMIRHIMSTYWPVDKNIYNNND